METIQKKFFNLLSLVKYVLESKVCVPFPKNMEPPKWPYKKPEGYEMYLEGQDRIDFDRLEPIIKEEIIKKIKAFHYFRNKFEETTKSILVLSKIKGGQHTINIALFKIIMDRFKYINIDVKYKKISNIRFDFKPSFLVVKSKNKIADLHKLTLKYKDSYISLSILVYYVDNKISFVSFLENTIEDINGDAIFQKIEMEINRIIRLIPLTHIL